MTRWREVLVLGWTFFAISSLLPAVEDGTELMLGWEAFRLALTGAGGIFGVFSAVSNLAMLATLAYGRVSRRARWPVAVMGGAGVFNGGYWMWWITLEDAEGMAVLAGYFVWVLSFLLVAVAYGMRCK